MISINDTHEAPKGAPTYRIRDEAKNAAIAVLGPLAIHEFDFVTFQLDDGRWDWNVPVEERPLSAAVVKANGGKKFLQARAAAKAITNQEGTPMADPNRLPVPPRRTLGKAASAKLPAETVIAAVDVAKLPSIQLGRMGFTDVAQNPSDGVAPPACNGLDIQPHDDLAIPAFLKRESTPEAKEKAKAAAKRIAKEVGPDRVIKDPPNIKAEAKRVGKALASAKPDKAKTAALAKKRTGEAPTKRASVSGGQSKTALIGEMLSRDGGCTTADILKATGWKAVNVPREGGKCGLKLKQKKDGKVTRYWAA